MGCKWFFLKARKNVMFLNKIDLPYCLVVFFVVCRVSGRFEARVASRANGFVCLSTAGHWLISPGLFFVT